MNSASAPCRDKGITAEVTDCFWQALENADAEMNRLYQSIRQQLQTEDKQRLVDAQRAWLRYRDANCSAEKALYTGGTAIYAAHFACLEENTRARTAELKVIYCVHLSCGDPGTPKRQPQNP